MPAHYGLEGAMWQRLEDMEIESPVGVVNIGDAAREIFTRETANYSAMLDGFWVSQDVMESVSQYAVRAEGWPDVSDHRAVMMEVRMEQDMRGVTDRSEKEAGGVRIPQMPAMKSTKMGDTAEEEEMDQRKFEKYLDRIDREGVEMLHIEKR